MKRLFTTLGLITAAAAGYAQETATNFTATDCNSASHTLFDKLDAGKTVVMVWVMPCGGCAQATSAAYTAVQDYAAAHPGKVEYFLISDNGDDNCTDLKTFAIAQGVNTANIAVFDNAGDVINQSDFGGDGMPHVVIASGTDHKIWFNKKNAAAGTGIVDALNKATGINEVAQQLSFSMSPNPAGDVLTIEYARPISRVTIISVSGQVVKDFSYERGKQNPVINMSKIPAGNYMIKVQDAEGRSGLQQIVKL